MKNKIYDITENIAKYTILTFAAIFGIIVTVLLLSVAFLWNITKIGVTIFICIFIYDYVTGSSILLNIIAAIKGAF